MPATCKDCGIIKTAENAYIFNKTYFKARCRICQRKVDKIKRNQMRSTIDGREIPNGMFLKADMEEKKHLNDGGAKYIEYLESKGKYPDCQKCSIKKCKYYGRDLIMIKCQNYKEKK